MAKLGRYSAQVKKVKSITAAKEVETAECGTIFVLTNGGYNITLPKLSEVPTGWWCEFGLGATTGSSNINILVDNDDSNSMIGVITTTSASANLNNAQGGQAYVILCATASFNFADNTGANDGRFSLVDVTKVTDTNWRVNATCFTAGFITGSAN
tara:strand:- start:99 stop:563 length:465 start_codon:yes stop_codon:yes gene_type:complete